MDVEEPNDSIFIGAEAEASTSAFKKVPEWDAESCTMCNKCVQLCRFNALASLGSEIVVFEHLCHNCNMCTDLCPVEALPSKSTEMGKISVFRNGRVILVDGRLNVDEEHPVPLIRELHDYIDDEFNLINIQLFDSPPGTSCSVVEAARRCDLVLLVTEPTPFGLSDLRQAVATMRELDKSVMVVINKYGSGIADIESYCEEEGIEVAGRIPFDMNVAKAYSRGELLYEDNLMSSILEEIYGRIAGFMQKKVK
jgi:MinD superfamily P-loop ATPase